MRDEGGALDAEAVEKSEKLPRVLLGAVGVLGGVRGQGSFGEPESRAIEGDGSAARQALTEAFDVGTGLLGYFGHGSVELWAQEEVLSVDDVAKLDNRARLPIVFTVTCLSGLFQHPVKPSLGETLVRAGNGGAVAALVPSSAAVLTDQNVLAQRMAAALGASSAPDGPQTLGDVVLTAQQGITNASDGVREVLLTFNLLGDPTLPLAR
jgi:hypothetical protein